MRRTILGNAFAEMVRDEADVPHAVVAFILVCALVIGGIMYLPHPLNMIVLFWMALPLALVLVVGTATLLVQWLRELDTGYVRRRIRELETEPRYVTETRGYGGVTASEYEDDLARGYESWTVEKDNPNYESARRGIERLQEKLRNRVA